MSGPDTIIPDDARPRLPRGVRLKHDTARGWLLLAPETVFGANGSSAEILKLCDGSRTFAALVDELAVRFGVPRARIAADAGALIAGLAEKRLIEL
ncbi:pyrroloquinoline quinone biosynthesis peptide chaperone PqqD [Xanthobacteraceae bacterium A53D]